METPARCLRCGIPRKDCTKPRTDRTVPLPAFKHFHTFKKPCYHEILTSIGQLNIPAMTETRLSQFVGHLIPPRGYLTGQTAIVTGAGQGIGAAIAEFFFNEGAKVVISDIDAGRSVLLSISTRA